MRLACVLVLRLQRGGPEVEQGARTKCCDLWKRESWGGARTQTRAGEAPANAAAADAKTSRTGCWAARAHQWPAPREFGNALLAREMLTREESEARRSCNLRRREASEDGRARELSGALEASLGASAHPAAERRVAEREPAAEDATCGSVRSAGAKLRALARRMVGTPASARRTR